MNTIFTLAKKELRDLFASPIAYVFIAVFLFLSFWLFFAGVFLVGQTTLRGFFSWLPILFVIFLPSITMGKWSDEKKSGTLEILMTLPASDWQFILGKFLSVVLFLLIVLALTFPLPIVISSLGDLDMGPVFGSYFGIFLLGSSYLALGLFISSLTRNQVISFLITVLVLFLFYILAEPLATNYIPSFMIPVFQYMSFNQHYESMARGVLDSRDVIYFLSTTVLFIYFNRLSLGMRKL